VKILHLSSEYPPAKIYGLGRFVHGLARAQAASGDDVLVLTNSSGGAEDDVVLDGVNVHRIEFPNPPRPADGHGEVLQFNHGLVSRFFDRRAAFAGVEIVASHDWLTALAAREIATELDVPLVVTFHDEVIGKHFGNLDREARFVRDLEALTAHDATQVIANSDFIAAQVRRHYGADRVTAIPGGIDPLLLRVSAERHLEDFRSALADPGEVLVTYVGRLDPEKGIEVLAQAARIATAERPRLRFVFAGTGREEGPLRQIIAPLGPRARLLGYLRGEALSLLYRSSDVVVVPSLYEPFGLVALEAMLAGATPVVSGAGGLREIVRDGEDGLVVPTGDARALAAALVRLADDEELRRRLRVSAQERARTEFAWERIAKRTRAVYEGALAAKRPVAEVAPLEPERPLVTVLVRSEAAGRRLVARTDYPNLEVVVAEADGAERAAGEYVCVVNGVEIPEGASGWLRGLVWTLETMDATTVSPGSGAPCRADAKNDGCFLARRSFFAGAEEGTGHWRQGADLQLPRSGPPSLPPPAPRGEGFRPSQSGTPEASIVLVAYNNLGYTRDAIDAVLAHTKTAFELVLVDNGSTDGSRDYFRDLGDRLPCQVIENSENLGYPKAANQGIRAARGRHVVLLNNDTQVRPGWLEALLEAARSTERVGAVTAKILNLDGSVQNAGGILHHVDGSFTIPHASEDRLAPPLAERREVANAGGPCLLLTRELIDDVGVFDEAYSPGYFEDSDLCLRAREAGFKLLYEPAAEVHHHGKATANAVAREGKLDLWGQFERNKRRFYERWAPRLASDEDERPRANPDPKRRILLCYDREATTTAAYCETALKNLGHEVVTAGHGQDVDLGDRPAREIVREAGGTFDLLLAIEGATYVPRELAGAGCPTAFWAIDNHLHTQEDGYFALAREFDSVFIAQRDYAPAFEQRGIHVSWLPLACDPAVHRRHEVERDLDLVFVGNVLPIHRRRRALLDRLARRFKVSEFKGVYLGSMARLLSRAKVVFNCSLAGDLNMRVFETLATGSLLVTDAIANGQEKFFGHGEHLALYDDASLEDVVAFYLGNREAREQVAARGQRLVTRHHTYEHRMRALVAKACQPVRQTQGATS
jgi:glycogen(starch) synthase